MSIDVIVNGGVTSSGAEFPGLIPLINRYISTVEDADDDTCATVSRYLQLISDRAAGKKICSKSLSKMSSCSVGRR